MILGMASLRPVLAFLNDEILGILVTFLSVTEILFYQWGRVCGKTGKTLNVVNHKRMSVIL